MITDAPLEHLLPVHNQLGESPIWEPREGALYWVDWGGGPIHRYEPASGQVQTFEVNRPVTALTRRASGGWLAVSHNSIDFWDPQTNQFTGFMGMPGRPGHALNTGQYCYNDCAVDRQGRLLVGTYNAQDPFAPDSTLYRINPDGSRHELETGFATVNGLGLSPEGKTLYLTDMRHHQILVYDYDTAAGTIDNRRLFAHVPPEQGMPDGLIVDSEGFVWSAHWEGWKLTRYDPDGKVEREVRFPLPLVICCAFGGPDLADLYVTTAWYGFSEEQKKAWPWSGDLFRVATGIRGLEEPAFQG